MTEHENLMKRCQRGATNLNDANNLLAECYGMLGKVEVAGSGEVPRATCRQRLAAEGKPYPRSSCAICGPFSPEWKKCDAAIKLEVDGR